MDVQGKHAIIFGGTSGIGKAAATLLAEKGATVVAVSRDPSKAGEPTKGITYAACDVRDQAALQELFAHHGPFDILISAATGGERALGPFMSMDMEGYQASFDKLWGYANVVRFGAGHVSENGAIVLVSGAPARKCKAGQIALSSVGGAVEAFARGLAGELAPIRINVMCPGTIDTPMVPAQGVERQKIYDDLVKGNIIERAGTPLEAAQGILFLVENDFVTGTTLDVDGGWILS